MDQIHLGSHVSVMHIKAMMLLVFLMSSGPETNMSSYVIRKQIYRQ